jgi:hypothetical protein
MIARKLTLGGDAKENGVVGTTSKSSASLDQDDGDQPARAGDHALARPGAFRDRLPASDASHRLIEAPVEEWSNDKGVDSGGSRAGAGANACKSCRHRDTAR